MLNGLVFIGIISLACIGYAFYLLECEARWNDSRFEMKLLGIGNRANDSFWY